MPPSATTKAASNCRSSSFDAGELIWDPADRTQFMRPRWRDPSTGRFTRLDPFAGIAAEPQSLHKYAYAEGDPVNGIDPSGNITLSSVSAALGNGVRLASLGFRIASAGLRSAQALETAISLHEFFFGGGIHRVRQAAEQIYRQWGHVPRASGTQRLLRQDFWEDATSVLSRNSAKLVARVTAQHGKSIVTRFANRKSFVWVIYMPTPDNGDRSPLDKLIANPPFRIPFPGFRISGVPVVLQFGGGGGDNRGRVFGMGVASVSKGVPTNQFFRMDYHEPHGKSKKDAYYWESSGSTYDFHFHVPK